MIMCTRALALLQWTTALRVDDLGETFLMFPGVEVLLLLLLPYYYFYSRQEVPVPVRMKLANSYLTYELHQMKNKHMQPKTASTDLFRFWKQSLSMLPPRFAMLPKSHALMQPCHNSPLFETPLRLSYLASRSSRKTMNQ